MYACKNFFRVRNGDVASRQGVLGGSWTQLGWLVDTAAVQATVVHMGSRDSGILRWRPGMGGGARHGRDGGKVLATMAAFVALNGRLGPWRESAAHVSDPAFLNGMSPSPLIPTGVMDAGHQVRTMDESDALRLCGDWLEGGQRSAACVCRKANLRGRRGPRNEGTLRP